MNLTKITSENEASLFRGNSICTRFLSAFARVYGYNYLRNLILPLIKTMEALPAGHAYDLDPAKAPGGDYEQNKRDLIYVASAFLDIVSASAPAIPSWVFSTSTVGYTSDFIFFLRMFREICAHIGKAVYVRAHLDKRKANKSRNEIWPEAKFQTLGAFIFLRFVIH